MDELELRDVIDILVDFDVRDACLREKTLTGVVNPRRISYSWALMPSRRGTAPVT